MSAEPFLGEIILVPYTFAPRGFAFCDGQLLSIAQNTALFALLGTTYGGDGRATFALPDLRGRVAVEAGQGPGLSDVQLGEAGGAETAALPQAVGASTEPANQVSVRNPYLGLHYCIALQGIFPSRD